MTEYSRMAKGVVTTLTGGGTSPIYLPFQPDYVEFVNLTAMDTPTSAFVTRANWDVNMGQGAAVFDLFNATPVLTTNATTTGGISTFYAGLMHHFGANQQIVSTTKASPTNIEVTGHGYVNGDVVLLQGMYSTQFTAGMPQMDGIYFTVTVVDANNFTVPWDSTGTAYTALAASPVGALVKKVLYPYLYAPGAVVISGIDINTPAGFTTVHTASAHNFVVGQEVAFRIPEAWGTIQLNSLPNNVIPGSPIYGYVVSVTDYNTVVVNINSAGYTAFNVNQPVASVSGLTPAQIVAVGDINTGGVQISAGSALYPPPYTVPFGTARVNTINGPAIQGAFFNNTRQGFVIGSVVAPTAAQLIYWRAYLHDLSIP